MAENQSGSAEMLWPVYEFRLLPSVIRQGFPVLRYAEGQWLPDDGEYDIAFANHNVCWMVELPYQRNILWSWTKGDWRANETRHPRGNPWHYMLRDGETEWGGGWGRDRHPNLLAGRDGMSWLCSRYGASNGRHVDFKFDDPHIAAGLLRERDTKRVVTFPAEPCCMYCGDASGAHEALARGVAA